MYTLGTISRHFWTIASPPIGPRGSSLRSMRLNWTLKLQQLSLLFSNPMLLFDTRSSPTQLLDSTRRIWLVLEALQMYIQTSLLVLHQAHECVTFVNYLPAEIVMVELRACRVASVGLEIMSQEMWARESLTPIYQITCGYHGFCALNNK